MSSRIIAVSEDVSRFLKRYLPDVDTPVIYNGLDIDEFDSLAASSSTIREEYGLQNKKLVALVGRIAPVKGIEDFVEAAELVLKKRDDAAFIAVGPDQDKDLAESVRKRVESLGLKDRVIFTGRRNDIPALLRESDIFVCSSKTEGFPYSILEAMAAGKPVVTTRCGGPEEIVIHEETGMHVDVGRSDQIAEAVTSLLNDESLSRRMGQKAREAVEQRYSAAAYAGSFEEVYARLAGSPIKKCNPNPWAQVTLDMASTMGDLGVKIRHLEHEVRDLRGFEAMIKDNVLCRGIRKIVSTLK